MEEEQLMRDDVLRKRQKLLHDGRNWKNYVWRESDQSVYTEIHRLFGERYRNARNPVNITLKNYIEMKQEAYETKKDDYLGISFAPKQRKHW